MNRLFSISIRAQLFLLILIVALPAIGIILYSGIKTRNDDITDARSETYQLVDKITSEEQNLLSAAEQLLITLAQLPDVRNHQAGRVQPILRRLHGLNAWYSNIFVADREGNVWAQAVDAKPFSISDRRYFMNARASGRFSSGEYVLSRATGKTAFNFAYPMKDEHDVMFGVVNVGIKMPYFEHILKKFPLIRGTRYVLLDHQGVILGSSAGGEQSSGKPYDPELFRIMKEGPAEKTYQGIIGSGATHIVTYRKLQLAGEQTPYLYIQADIPLGAVLSGANKALLVNIAILTPVLMLAIAFAWLVGKRSIADRLAILERASQSVASGDLHVRVSDLVAGGELGKLGLSFDRMADQLAVRDQDMRESEARFRSIFNGTMDGIALFDVAGQRFIMGNKPLCELIGCTDEELRTMKPEDIHPPDALPRVRKHFEETMRGEISIFQDMPVKRKDGSIFYADITASLLQLDGRQHFLGVFRDVTERKRAEEEHARLLSVLELSVNEIYLFDAETLRFQYVNSGALQNLGYSRELIGAMTPLDIKPRFTETTFRALVAPLLAHQKSKEVFQTVHRRSDGSLYPVEVHLQLVEQRTERMFLAIIIDITDRKQAEEEREKLQAQLIQAQKMESVGQLAGGVAHDFNNILTAIIGYGSLLQMKISAQDPLRINVDHILESAGRAAQLTHSLLAFSRKQILNMKAVHLNEILTGQEHFLRRIIGEDIEMRTILRGDMVVLADSGQIQQVLMNLATNARDAMPTGGQLTIETTLLEMNKAFISAHGFGESGSYAVISVTDTGIGMDDKAKQKIFEPFFTTKEVGRGTGLGMAIVYGIVKQHKGYVNVHSQVGEGTTFTIYLPVHGGEAAQREKSVAESPPLTGTETILLAEDDATLRSFFQDILIKHGYTVVAAENGEDAINKFFERKDEIQLCLIDMIMPKKSGREVYEAIQKIKPGLKVIFSSGYTADKVLWEGLPAGSEFIAKPASPQKYLSKIREVLDGYVTK